MPTFQKAPKEVRAMADSLLAEFESHRPLLDVKLNIDLVFAYCDRDDDGNPTNHALTKNGIRALGIARIMPLKDRAMGRGDAEICLDGDYWTQTASEEQQRALLDHELHHLSLKLVKKAVQFDDLGRPKLRMRKHDVEVGWFAVIADRHGKHSQEQIQAASILDSLGQFFWPTLVGDGKAKALTSGKK